MKRLLCVFCLLAACLALVCCTEDRTGGGEPLPAPAPENLTAQEGDGQVALRWTEPVSDGLLESDVRWNPGGGQRTMHVGFNYLVVDGLANGTEYAFSVTAVYADGRRSDSVSVKAVPHVGPWPEEGVNGTYINNGIVQLGVDMDRGGAVFHFSEVNTKRNLLNHADEGRFIQQSYYGEADGSDWNGQSWVWNPIQGGGCRGEKARVISQEITENSIRVVSTPVHWATGEAVTDCEMEERITLDGRIARIHYTFRNTGPGATDHPATSQEMPAVFVDYALKNLVYYDGSSPWTGGPLRRDVPGWPNEERTRTEHWAAYVDDSDWGIGVYTPGTPLSTTYRFDGPSGPTGGGCSYFAPIRNFAVAKGLVLEYDVYLYIGTVEEIRSAFDAIRTDGWEIDDSGFPEGYLYVKESSGVAVEELESSPSEGYTYRWTATSGEASVTTQRIAAAIPGPVLTFMYKSDRDVPLSVVLDEDSQTPVRIEPLTASSDWRLYEFDMGQAVEQCGWGSIGSRMQLLLGGGAGAVLEIKQLHMRERNAHENELASALFIELQEPRSDLERFEDLTDYFSYETGFAYLLQAEKGGVDPYIHTAVRSRAIASDENYLSFEYKCEKGGTVELFLKIIAGGSIPGLSFPTASDWTPITFDLSEGKASVLEKFPDACSAGGRMRFDIDGTDGAPLYIRAIRIHR